MMTRRACDLESKLKIALLELKACKETNTTLLQELDDHQVDMSQMIAKQTDLKKQLSEQDIVFEDMRDQRDHLQSTLLSYQHDQELYETALRHIRDLEQELNLTKIKLDQHCVCNKKLEEPTNINTMDLFSELIQASPSTLQNLSIPTIDLTTPKPIKNNNINKMCISGSNKIKNMLRSRNFVSAFQYYQKCIKNILKTQMFVNKNWTCTLNLRNVINY